MTKKVRESALEMKRDTLETETVKVMTRKQFSLSSFLVHFVLIILAAVVIVPLVLPFLFAFKTPLEFAYNPWGLAKRLRWENFRIAWEQVQIGTAMFNTAIICLGTVCLTVPPAALAGYIFARYRTRVTDVLFYFIMAGFFVPTLMVLIPLYKVVVGLHLIDTLPGVFLPLAAFGIPFWTMIYRAFYKTLPVELMEAARIDGAGHWRIFIQIMFPLAKAATVLATLLTFMGAWSDYLIGLVLLNSQEHFTLQLRIAQFIGNLGANFFPQYAAGVIISAAPTILLYVLFHKKIIEGTTLAGALKG
jgi:ABC-type glycerol-3-phosphate transport system permease component